jgi:polyisoprenoid-binding protein YceI
MITRVSHIALAAIAAIVLAAPAFAQSSAWTLDSDHSTGRLSLSATADPSASFDVGVARVKGTVNLSDGEITDPSFTFTIYPAGQDPNAIGAGGNLNLAEFSNVARASVIQFQSRQVQIAENGDLIVTGDLTSTHLERPVLITAFSEDYAGPVYGEPEVRSTTREVTFVFPGGATRLAKATDSRKLKLAGATTIATEDFPGLFEAVTDANWPIVVEDRECTTPATIGEEYHGSSCTGTPVLPRTQGPAYNTIGEDYPGTEPAPSHARDNVKIALNLELTRGNSHSAAGTAAAE